MDETPSSANKDTSGLNKLDLSQLNAFSFGTQWTEDKSSGASRRPEGGPREPRRGDRDDHRGDRPQHQGHGDPKRDRRGFRKPAGPVPAGGAAPAEGGPRPPREGGFRENGPRGEHGGPRREGGPRFGGHGHREGGAHAVDRGPYISPFFNVTFYPDDTGFAVLAKAVRASCRTYELFEIARVVIGKNDRFVAVIQRKHPEGQAPAEGVPLKDRPIFISAPDGLPFDTEDAAINHVLAHHLGQFFDAAEVEIEAPKGNYQVVNRCTVTGELLAPPNYHRYNQIVQQHHATHVRLPFEVYKTSKIETVRDPEIVNQWLEKMKKVTRYTWKQAAPVAPAAAPASLEAAVESAEAPAAEAPAAEPALAFDSIEEARLHLLTHARDRVVRSYESVRLAGRLLETMPQGEIRRAVEGCLERQRRFPLDTANALRGRLRREGFTIFKKGSKGISYVCAVKRKFRVPGQTFADSIGALIAFLEANPMTKESDLPVKFLGLALPEKPAADAPAEQAAPVLSVEQQQKLVRMRNDLRWLVGEGYVTEFIDGRLFAPPAMVEARKKEIESSEHDTENFPEVPVEETAPAQASAPAAPAGSEAPVRTESEPPAEEPIP